MMENLSLIHEGRLFNMFFEKKSPKMAILVALGNRLLDCGGQNVKVEFFFRSVLMGDSKPDNLLSYILLGETDEAEREKLKRETLENCFAFLYACREYLDATTVQAINAFAAEQPADFIRVVEEKVAFSKMREAVAEARRPWVHPDIAKICEDAVAGLGSSAAAKIGDGGVGNYYGADPVH